MVPVVVVGLALDDGLRPVVLLTPFSGGPQRSTVVRIEIDRDEASSLSAAIVGDASPRPIAQDLLRDVIGVSGAMLERVEIRSAVRDGFHAELHLAAATGPLVLACRPSDAIALTLRLDSPLFLAASVLDQERPPQPLDDERVLAAFRRFLDGAAPADFLG